MYNLTQLFTNSEFVEGVKGADYTATIEALTSGALVYVCIFAAYLLLVYLLLRFVVDHDLFFGSARLLRNKCKKPKATVTLMILVLYGVVLAVPVVLGAIWGIHVAYSSFVDHTVGFAIFFTVMFISASLIGTSTWYAHSWALERTTLLCLQIGTLAVSAFGICMTVAKNYTFTGATAISLVLNFAPACYLVYMKSRWDDLDLKMLFREIGRHMLDGKFSLAILEQNDEQSQKAED
jgi:hypothetical protein